MRATAWLVAAITTTLALAAPAFALEDGIVETSSMNPSEDGLRIDFARTITNSTPDPIAIAPRDLRKNGSSITLTVIAMTTGSFSNGIWTVGTIEGGQTASIIYTGGTAATTTSATPVTSTTAVAEELPLTGLNHHLGGFAIVALTMIGLGTVLLHTAKN